MDNRAVLAYQNGYLQLLFGPANELDGYFIALPGAPPPKIRACYSNPAEVTRPPETSSANQVSLELGSRSQ